MTKRFISYPSIEQYRNVISSIKHMASYVGQDENGDPIYNKNYEKPVISFKGTVKLHGTNASVAYNEIDSLWAQSRNNIITIEKDNAGFAFFVEGHKEQFLDLINTVKERENIDTKTHNIVISGEWCGKGIQKGVSISELPKMFVIFGVKIAPFEQPEDNSIPSVWVDHTELRSPESQIFNIEDFPTFDIDIDFNRPDIAQTQIVKWVEEVENECPVGKAFRVGGECHTGEGIVFKGWYKGCQLMFKAKGDKHSASRVKTIAPVDVEKMNAVHEFVDYAVTENRLNQGIEQVFTTNAEEPSIRKMGDFIRWIVNDVIKEETDTLVKNGIEPKQVNKFISNKARIWFQEFLDKQTGL